MAEGFSKPLRRGWLDVRDKMSRLLVLTVSEYSSHEFFSEVHVFEFINNFNIFAGFEFDIGEVLEGLLGVAVSTRHFYVIVCPKFNYN